MNSQEIRERYRDFFVRNGHEPWPSDSLVPKNDPTLLFTSAGMVQFKPYFRGEMGDVLKRATTCQKCFRTSDIENVGFTHRHHTFFEMLGNFSFGDYFKQEAIQWAWEFSLDELGLDPNRIWVSIFTNDDEAAELWRKEVGFPEERMVRFGVEDNWWPGPGITGPSGPCSELYYDMGEEYGPSTGPSDDNHRYLEYWNLVFTQFDTRPDGSQQPLARKNIDTGAGLDRIAAIVQGKFSNFENDLLFPIIQHIEERSGQSFNDDPKKDIAFRVIADHARATVFVLTDNVTPSNTGRGYVLRRIMRRAIRYGLVLGIEDNLLVPAMEVAADIARNEYPDLLDRFEYTSKVAEAEERSFKSGRFSWGYGNIMGGLTSIEEKSYGALAKSGTQPLQGILRNYGLPPGNGFFLQMGEPGSGFFHGDPEGINQFAAHGAHLAMFTTGCGSTTGGLIPVLKVIGNPKRMQLIRDNADFDATPIIRGEAGIQEMGEALYDELLAVASGKLTKSEIYGHYEV